MIGRRGIYRFLTQFAVIGLWFGLMSGNSLEAADTVTVSTAFNQTGSIGFVTLKKGDLLLVRISEAPAACYSYNLKRVALNEIQKTALLSAGTVQIEFTHDGQSKAYQIVGSPDSGDNCKTAPAGRTWEVLVETPGWRLGFAGAFTVDSLVSDRFFLEEIADNSAAGSSGGTETTFFAIRRSDQGTSDFNLGTAAMIHLFHSDPRRLGGWSPVSFGLGTNSSQNLRYYIGTSFRFSDKLYITGGVALGGVDELPVQFLNPPTNRTNDSNVLSNLDHRNKAGLFFSLSYNFGNIGADFFKGKFSKDAPEPTSVTLKNGGQ